MTPEEKDPKWPKQITFPSDVSFDGPPPPPSTDDIAQFALGTEEEQAKREKRYARGVSRRDQLRIYVEMERMRETKDWSAASSAHFVALYVRCHRLVYGVEPDELTMSKTYSAACRAAGLLLSKRFGGSRARFLDFLRWVWLREKGREDWRRENPEKSGGGRLAWRSQFGIASSLLTEWRVDGQRTKSAGGTRR